MPAFGSARKVEHRSSRGARIESEEFRKTIGGREGGRFFRKTFGFLMHVGRFGHLGRHDGLGRLERFGSVRRIRAFDRPLAEGDGGFGGRGCGICVHRIAHTGVAGLGSLFGRILIELLFRGLPYGGNPVLAGLALRTDLPGIEPAADGGRGHGARRVGRARRVGSFNGFGCFSCFGRFGRFGGFFDVGLFGRFGRFRPFVGLGACGRLTVTHGPVCGLKPSIVRLAEALQKFLRNLLRIRIVFRES